MNIIDIADRVITLELYPEEALLLAQACEHCHWDSLFDTNILGTLVETMAAAFGAMALAGGARSYIQENKAAEVTYRSMRDDRMLDPGYVAARER